jgi:hypothetical protein
MDPRRVWLVARTLQLSTFCRNQARHSNSTRKASTERKIERKIYMMAARAPIRESLKRINRPAYHCMTK